MKAKAEKFGKGNKGGMPGAKKASGVNVKKGLSMEQKEPMNASDDESAEHEEEASTPGLPKGSMPMMHKIPENLLKHQSHLHEAGGFVAKK